MTFGLILLTLALSASAQTGEKIEALLKESKVPAAGIGIIRDGRVRQVSVHGQLRAGDPAPYDTIFNVASLTKPIVTMLTLKLVSTGRWSLDAPLADYWVDPDVAEDPRSKMLTTRHVLSHQTGFLNWRWLEPSKKLKFNSDPGTKFGYSGEGFEYLRNALERKFKRSLSELSHSLIFAPLGMTDTRHAWDAHTDETRFARWHDGSGNHTYTDHKRGANAADDLLTTVEDYSRFGAWVINGAGLSPALFADMVKPHAKMGLGWEVHKDLTGGEYALIHSGSDEGVNTLIVLLPVSKQGLIVLTNGDNGHKLYEPLIVESLALGSELMTRAK